MKAKAINVKIPGLYIHVPFCISKCGYCDFYSVTSVSAIPDFLEALFKEMTMYRGDFDSFDTVYFGGGTPSVLSSEQVKAILSGPILRPEDPRLSWA
jgi:oxygen-independent coproporphyrinogen-3 oxidase